jgi:hypothetical protein
MVKALSSPIRNCPFAGILDDSHFMEEWNDFNLLHVNILENQEGGRHEQTISEPIPPLNILPPHE